MPTVFSFYVIAPSRRVPEDLEQFGARWAEVEGHVIAVIDAMDELDRLVGRRVLGARMDSAFEPEECAAVVARLSALSPEEIRRIEEQPLLDAICWAIRDTAEEAIRRGRRMVISSHV